MAKVEIKKNYVIEGGIYDHETRTITVETKESVIEVNIDDFLSKIDGCNVKIIASTDVIED